jgi:glucose/arabinose dehydrogenase
MITNRKLLSIFLLASLLVGCTISSTAQTSNLVPHKITLQNGKSFNLNLPAGFDITVVAQGQRRVRFFAQAPDRRIFVTNMYNLADNKLGAVYILDGFDQRTGKITRMVPYLTNLRNPNSVGFFTDSRGAQWLYLALTDKLVRYPYKVGDMKPSGAPQTLATFPDYGLSYKYGGWHLTRTVAFGPNGKVYVSVGSSCNACVEKEDVRASIVEMNPDGTGQRIYAKGLRNAVDIKWVGNRLLATNQGADHLGDDRPEETFYVIKNNADYGWPYCYQYQGKVYADPKFPRPSGCRNTPLAITGFPGHASALGFQYFAMAADNDQSPESNYDPLLQGAYLVALHGSTKVALEHGYRIVRVTEQGQVKDFITGFQQNVSKINGRPCGILRTGPDAFLFTDDYSGTIYYVFKKKGRWGEG